MARMYLWSFKNCLSSSNCNPSKGWLSVVVISWKDVLNFVKFWMICASSTNSQIQKMISQCISNSGSLMWHHCCACLSLKLHLQLYFEESGFYIVLALVMQLDQEGQNESSRLDFALCNVWQGVTWLSHIHHSAADSEQQDCRDTSARQSNAIESIVQAEAIHSWL